MLWVSRENKRMPLVLDMIILHIVHACCIAFMPVLFSTQFHMVFLPRGKYFQNETPIFWVREIQPLHNKTIVKKNCQFNANFMNIIEGTLLATFIQCIDRDKLTMSSNLSLI